MHVREAEASELAALARLWYDSWQDSHAHLLPRELIRLRTLDSFRERLRVALPAVRVVGPVGAPLGFCLVRGDELKHGWRRAGTMVNRAETSEGAFLLDTWRYEKALSPDP